MLAVLLSTTVTLVPMYATPAAEQLPVMAGRIAGVTVYEPPMTALGDYVAPGDVDFIDRWLRAAPQRNAAAFVISTDMLAYGGLDASRVPAVNDAEAIARLQVLARLRSAHPHAWIGAFGTVMRLEPTAVTRTGEAATYFEMAQYPTWEYIWDYAQLHDPPLPSEQVRAARLESLIGQYPLQQYLYTRARDRDVDLAAIRISTQGASDRLVLGQDDAGPIGLHVRDVRALQDEVRRLHAQTRVAIEPGADELGIALTAHAMAHSIDWTPHVAVYYSRPGGGRTQDPFEYAAVNQTVGSLIRLCGGVRDDIRPDITLIVRAPHSSAAEDQALMHTMQYLIRLGRSVAFVDLTFLENSNAGQASFARTLIESGIASKLDAYSSWNTDANSVGIALGEAIAAGVGRRTARYDPVAHAEFMLDRYIDDYLYHTRVRPQVNAELTAHGYTEHYWLPSNTAQWANRRVAQLILPAAHDLLAKLYPQYRATRLQVALPWPRTFEIRSEITLRPVDPPR